MPEIYSFKELDRLIIQARLFFRNNLDKTQQEIENLIELCFKFLRSISKFHSQKEWENSQQEYSLSVLMQSMETILSMYYLSESGYWDLSLTFKRNIAELFAVAIGIGYDSQCFIDWKNERDNINTFGKLTKRIEESKSIPLLDKNFLPLLKKYWQESSRVNAHNLSKESIRTLVKSGKINFEPKTIKPEFQQKRLRSIRNMLIDLLFLIVGIFNYGEVAKNNKIKFPESLVLIREANNFFKNKELKMQDTI